MYRFDFRSHAVKLRDPVGCDGQNGTNTPAVETLGNTKMPLEGAWFGVNGITVTVTFDQQQLRRNIEYIWGADAQLIVNLD